MHWELLSLCACMSVRICVDRLVTAAWPSLSIIRLVESPRHVREMAVQEGMVIFHRE